MTQQPTFWSNTLPLDAMAGEDPTIAGVRARLAARVSEAHVFQDSWYEPCFSMLAAPGPDWETFSCGRSLPRTHWHLLRHRPTGVWLGWRVHEVRHSPDPAASSPTHPVGQTIREGDFNSLSQDTARRHLHEAVLVSPMGRSLEGLMVEMVRQGRDVSGIRNTYPYGEIAALSLVLGMDHPEVEPLRFLYAMEALSEAEDLANERGLSLYPFHRSARLEGWARTPSKASAPASA